MTLLSGACWAVSDDDGTGQSGTEFDQAWVDAVEASINALIHSATNPAVSPANIIDEVVAARGSAASLDARLDAAMSEAGVPVVPQEVITARGNKASLDARLDVAMDDDGVLIGTLSSAQYQRSLGSRNIAINGDLSRWTGGASAAPDGFTLAGAGATIVRTGVGEADTFHFGTGSNYAAKITRAGTNWTLTQTVISSGDFAKFTNVKSQKISILVKMKTSVASHGRITIDDGSTTTSSSFHTGGNTEEDITVTHTIAAGATELTFYIEGRTTDGDLYVSGFNVVFADVAPSDWQPYSVTRDVHPRQVHVVIATVGNVGAGEDTLATYIAPAGELARDGMSYRGVFWGHTANNANAKTLRARLIEGANNNILVSGALTVSEAGNWLLGFEIKRSGAATPRAAAQIVSGPANSQTTFTAATVSLPTAAPANAIELRITGEAVADNDITIEGGTIMLHP